MIIIYVGLPSHGPWSLVNVSTLRAMFHLKSCIIQVVARAETRETIQTLGNYFLSLTIVKIQRLKKCHH